MQKRRIKSGAVSSLLVVLTVLVTWSSSAFAIIGGMYSEDDQGSYLLDIKTDDGDEVICSGVAIAPRLYLTAGHCVAVGFVGYEPEMRIITGPEREFTQDDEVFEVTGRYLHPEFNQAFIEGGFDLAILVVERDFPTHVTLPTERLPDETWELLAVGYGLSDDDMMGHRFSVTLPVQMRDEEKVLVGDAMVSACNGDSGGPLFDAHGNVVATLSYGSPGCTMGMTATLLFPHLEFIHKVVDYEEYKQSAQEEPTPPTDDNSSETCSQSGYTPASPPPIFILCMVSFMWGIRRRCMKLE